MPHLTPAGWSDRLVSRRLVVSALDSRSSAAFPLTYLVDQVLVMLRWRVTTTLLACGVSFVYSHARACSLPFFHAHLRFDTTKPGELTTRIKGDTLVVSQGIGIKVCCLFRSPCGSCIASHSVGSPSSAFVSCHRMWLGGACQPDSRCRLDNLVPYRPTSSLSSTRLFYWKNMRRILFGPLSCFVPILLHKTRINAPHLHFFRDLQPLIPANASLFVYFARLNLTNEQLARLIQFLSMFISGFTIGFVRGWELALVRADLAVPKMREGRLLRTGK